MQQHFDGIAQAYYDIVDRTWYDVGYYHAKESAFLRDWMPKSMSLAIDAGCGPGRHALTLCEHARQVVAVDMSRKMLQIARDCCRAKGAAAAEYVQADVRHLPIRSGIADFVLNLEVLEHLPGKEHDARAALSEFRRVLRTSGTLLTEAPLRRHVWWRRLYKAAASFKELSTDEKTRYYARTPLVVDHFFREEDIDRALAEVGFGPSEKRFVRFFPAGLVERHPGVASIEPIFEKSPILRHFCREALWRTTRSSAAGRPFRAP